MTNSENTLRKIVRKWGCSKCIIIHKDDCKNLNIKVNDQVVIEILKVIRDEDRKNEGGRPYEIKKRKE